MKQVDDDGGVALMVDTENAFAAAAAAAVILSDNLEERYLLRHRCSVGDILITEKVIASTGRMQCADSECPVDWSIKRKSKSDEKVKVKYLPGRQ